MTKRIGSRFGLAVIATCASACVGAVLLSGAGEDAAAASPDASFSVLQAPPVAAHASKDPELQTLQSYYPKLQLVGAVQVLSDNAGVVWLTHSTAGELCLIEEPAQNANGVKSRFGCRDAAVAAQEGIVAGVPGHWYGVAPDGTSVSATVDGADGDVATRSNAFRLPAGATAVTIGSAASALPTGR